MAVSKAPPPAASMIVRNLLVSIFLPVVEANTFVKVSRPCKEPGGAQRACGGRLHGGKEPCKHELRRDARSDVFERGITVTCVQYGRVSRLEMV